MSEQTVDRIIVITIGAVYVSPVLTWLAHWLIAAHAFTL